MIFFSYFTSVIWFFDMIWMFYAEGRADHNAGLTTANTQDCAIMMCFLPLYIFEAMYVKNNIRSTWLLLISTLILASSLYFKSRSATLALSLMIFVTLIHMSKKFWLLLLPLIATYPFIKIHLLHDPGRLTMYKLYLSFWDKSEAYFWGLGFGSWDYFARFIKTDWGTTYFLFHSDWLQLFVEGGILGFVLAITLLIYLIYQTRNILYLQLSILGFSGIMLVYSPLRFIIAQVFVFMIIREVIRMKRAC